MESVRPPRNNPGKIAAIITLLLLPSRMKADPLGGSLETGTSVSHAYQARSVFTNPAALPYQAELNGAALTTSFTYGVSDLYQDEYSFGFALGYLGFGVESLSAAAGKMSRYSFAAGMPLSSSVFLGTRLALVRSDVVALGPYESMDLGIQYRPLNFLAFGVLVNGLNRPTVAGARSPVQWIFGGTLRPVDRVELSIDADTSSQDFAKRWGYQAGASFEALSGLKLRVGYHDTYRWQAGLQLHIGAAAMHSSYQPDTPARKVAFGLQMATSPFKSGLQARTALKIKLDGEIEEQGSEPGLFTKGRPSLLEILEELERVRHDRSVPLVILDIEDFPLGLAAAQDVYEAVLELRRAGKKVEAYLGTAGIPEYLIASAAEKIYMDEAGEIRFLGLKAERYFLKGTLDKIGVEGEFMAKGEYKSAPEMFIRKESSPLNRKTLLDLLNAEEKELVALLTKSREIDEKKWRAMVSHALYGAQDAVDAKIVDGIAGLSMELAKLKRSHVIRERTRTQSDRLSLPKKVAVIVAEGDILQKRARLLSLGGRSVVTPDRMERRFRRALADGRTKAIVLRVSSPGGEILPSHEIAAMVEQAKREKPVIVSMGDVAASGGYFIAAPAEKIFARPLTLTGSIGVYLGKFNLGGLFKKLELQKEILSHAPFAGLYSEDRPWGPEERKIMVRRLDQYYDAFVAYVAAKRKISTAEAETAAKGRVWLGAQAKPLKLVDETGGYLETIRYAASRAGVGADDYEIWEVRDIPGLFELFGDDGLFVRSSPEANLAATLLGPSAARDLMWMVSLRERPFLYWSPLNRIE